MTLITLILTALLVALGFWQLARAAEKAQLIARFDENTVLPALTLSNADFSDKRLGYRQVVVAGQYADTPVIVLNNQLDQGRIGYHQLGLFLLAESAKYLLIDRGWVPATAEGTPNINRLKPPLHDQQLEGMLVPAPRVGIRMGELHYQSGTPLMELPYLDLSWLGKTLHADLQPLVLLLDEQAIDCYKRQRQQIWLSPTRHQGYALEWFSLALTLVVIYIVTNLKRSDSS